MFQVHYSIISGPRRLFESQFISFPGLGKEGRLRMSTERGFTNQRITTNFMFRTSGNLEARIVAHHAAFISLALIMQLLFLNSRFGPACFGQGKRRAARHLLPFSPFHIAASILGLRPISRLLLNLRHGPCNLIICIACSLPGNRRARRSIPACSSCISGGRIILFPSGFILVCRCVPATWSGPSGRSYIMSCFPTLPGSVPCRSPENRHYAITLLSL